MTQDSTDNRRKWERCVLQMMVEAVRTQRRYGEPARIVNLRLKDMSRGGMGAHSPIALDPAEPITIFFPPMGSQPGHDFTARVVRCEREEDIYGVGLCFQEGLAEQASPFNEAKQE